MMSNVNDEYDKSDGEFIYDANKPGAIEFERTQKEISVVESKLDVENLSGDELARFVYQRTGIKRKLATKSTDTVIISGSAGAKIIKGDLVGTDTLNFVFLEEKIIGENGLVNVLVECQQFGAIGNVPANSINKFPVSISGLVNVYNPKPFSNGYEAETNSELRQRYFDKLQKPGKAGNQYHYEEWAKEVTGVGDARCVPRWNGPLTVKVVIIDSNKQPASPELIEKVFNYIELERPFGAIVTVVSAIGIPINISTSLSLMDGYTEDMAKNNIKATTTKYLQEIAFKTKSISYAKTGSNILDSEGVLDYQDLLVNNGTANIVIGDEEVAIMGGVNE
ncbi:baseplate J/gp47 family protein [Viridibacillus arvi]|uniref:baseplate J/gp47 family protein n=1 Tax=Viridibacillus arvi TaxID=263475 RepID=UPI003D0748E4